MSAPPNIPLRPPSEVMRLERMGAMFQTRLSFMRILLRRMAKENWRITRPVFDLDQDGFGCAVYQVDIQNRVYSLIAFSQDLAPEARTDRVIAEAWDATFSFFDGIPREEDLRRLRDNTPLQEAGRFRASELTLARANKSLRLYHHVVASLAAGQQPALKMIRDIGYLMRTTAVYGSGKFGCADRGKIAARPEFHAPFQVELLTVYLIRQFTFDLVDHVAAAQGGSSAVTLAPELKRYLGIGNATGLGMAPFLVNHPILLHHWVQARETALARVRSLKIVTASEIAALRRFAAKAVRSVAEWSVEDALQMERIVRLRSDTIELLTHLQRDDIFDAEHPLDQIYLWVQARFPIEVQELTVSLLLEPFSEMVDDLADDLAAHETPIWDPAMNLRDLSDLIDQHYAWVHDCHLEDATSQSRFWYYSQEKFEPRLGHREEVPGQELEMPLAVARDLLALKTALATEAESQTVADFARRHARFRHILRRVQTTAKYPYAEINDNLIDDNFRPIDMLRFKLAYFGASKFDPKSDLWTRITLYQGAPLPEDFGVRDIDDWSFVSAPGDAA